jgi:large subunit ribosomal protein L2
VERLEYDPNRTSYIALIRYADGQLAYIIAPQRLNAGDEVVSGENVDVKPGNAMPLGNMPVGTIVHNVEMKPGREARWPELLGPMRSSLAETRATLCCD